MRNALITGITGQDGGSRAEFLVSKGCKQLLALKCRSFATTTRTPVGQRVMRLSQGGLQRP